MVENRRSIGNRKERNGAPCSRACVHLPSLIVLVAAVGHEVSNSSRFAGRITIVIAAASASLAFVGITTSPRSSHKGDLSPVRTAPASWNRCAMRTRLRVPEHRADVVGRLLG